MQVELERIDNPTPGRSVGFEVKHLRFYVERLGDPEAATHCSTTNCLGTGHWLVVIGHFEAGEGRDHPRACTRCVAEMLGVEPNQLK